MSGLHPASHTRVWITIFTITKENGEKVIFEGPYIFAFNYDEAKQEAELLSNSAISIDKKIAVEIVGELNEKTKQAIIH
jgi:hypothetical protein